MFQARVSVRFIYAPSRWLYPLLSRWDLGVRTDSFQITNWVYGNRDRARTTFFHSADCVMWQATTGGRDRIVVSGPTYIRSKVEFAFSTQGQNTDAWNALVLSGVRGVAGPPDATTAADPLSPTPGSTTEALPNPAPSSAPSPTTTRTRGFRRLGTDLGSGHARKGTPSTAAPHAAVPTPDPTALLPANPGRGRRKPPVPARNLSPGIVAIVVIAAVVCVPFLFALTARFTIGHLAPPTISGVQTTQCTLNPDRTQVAWSGTVTATEANPILNGETIEVQLVLPDKTQAASTDVALPTLNKGANPLGPVDVPVPGAPAAVQCVASVTYPQVR
jgi:hypothetical protein